jgi:hypothetical protein
VVATTRSFIWCADGVRMYIRRSHVRAYWLPRSIFKLTMICCIYCMLLRLFLNTYIMMCVGHQTYMHVVEFHPRGAKKASYYNTCFTTIMHHVLCAKSFLTQHHHSRWMQHTLGSSKKHSACHCTQATIGAGMEQNS